MYKRQPTAYAEIRYVTDDLQLALYEEQGSKGQLLKRLPSGTELEVLEESQSRLFARVQTPDGTIGWTKAGFLIKSKPARALLKELEQKTANLTSELERTQAELAEQRNAVTRLRDEKTQALSELAEQRQIHATGAGTLPQQHQENTAYRQPPVAEQVSIPLRWGLAATGLTLVLGFILGLSWFDYRSRKRHGGYRIY